MSGRGDISGASLDILSDFERIDFDRSRLAGIAGWICNRYGEGGRIEVGLAILDNEQMQELNRRFLGKDRTTDCLSFDLSDDCSVEPGPFEVAVNGQMAIEQGQARGHGPESELALYVAHGLLHLLGFDDETSAGAAAMHDAEAEALAECGYKRVFDV